MHIIRVIHAIHHVPRNRYCPAINRISQNRIISVNNPTHKPVVPSVAATNAGVRPDSISIFICWTRFSPFMRPKSSDLIFLYRFHNKLR